MLLVKKVTKVFLLIRGLCCAQALAEMKEKIRILQNEVEILRAESISKDKALSRSASTTRTPSTRTYQPSNAGTEAPALLLMRHFGFGLQA